MSERYYILVGDTTTMNGIVMSGNPMMQIDGKMMAFVGDMVQCPTCLCPGIIQAMGARANVVDAAGRSAALEGDLCICKCVPPPTLKSKQTLVKSSAGF